MLNNPGHDVGAAKVTPDAAVPRPGAAEPEVAPDEALPRSGLMMIFGQILLIALAGLYLFGIVWLYIQLPWLALVAIAVAAGIILGGVFSRMRKPPHPGN